MKTCCSSRSPASLGSEFPSQELGVTLALQVPALRPLALKFSAEGRLHPVSGSHAGAAVWNYPERGLAPARR